MTFHVATVLSDGVLGIARIVASVIATVVFLWIFSKGPNLDAIPTVGSENWLDSWCAGYKSRRDAIDVIQQGYEKYKSTPFKVADRYRWIVVLGGQQHMEEMRNAPDDALSFNEAANETLKIEYTLGHSVYKNPYHGETVRSHLTANLGTLFREVRDEIFVAFEEILNLRDNEWKSIPAFDVVEQVVCRATNRLFVGHPLCRDDDWLDLNLRFTSVVVEGGKRIARFPRFLAPLVARFVTDVPGSTKRAMMHLGQMIEERLQCLEEYGDDWADKPNDLLTWLLNEAQGPERTVKLLTMRVLAVNFAAIHTTSNSFAHALFLLAKNPQYIQPLRDEVESIVEKEGWSKASLGKMRKIDSFVKETQRLVGIGSVGMLRKALKDFTFSDGTFIPKGTTIVVPLRALHLDDEYYENAREFIPFRFSDMRGEEGAKHHFVSTSLQYLPFGHGKHACPGRFFAAIELKSMLAHVVMTYDVKLENSADLHKQIHDSFNVTLDPLVKVMFRKRIY